MAIEAGAPARGTPPARETPPTDRVKMESLDERYCDVTGGTMDLTLAGMFLRHRVFFCYLTTSNPQVVCVV